MKPTVEVSELISNEPSITHFDNTTEYRLNDELHRTSGPAIEWPDGSVEYWVNDVRMPEIEFKFWFPVDLQ